MRKQLGLVLGAAGVAGFVMAAKRIADAPPDPEISARAGAAAHSGPWTQGHADVNGIRLHYAEIGAGPLVILLHGFPQCWYEWHDVMPRLAGYFHLVAPDMRGYNLSDKPRGVSEYTLDKVAEDIASLIEALGEERAHIVGHDWGGEVAWHMGMYRPERVDRLVVINAPHPAAFQREARRPEQLLRSSYTLFFQLPVVSEAAIRLLLRLGLRATAYVPQTFSDQTLDVYENAVSQPYAATSMLNYYRAAFRQAFNPLQTRLQTVTCPTMLLWGMRDFALPPRLAEGTEHWVPGLQVEWIEDSGHWVPEEKPPLIADSLLRFFTRNPQARTY